MVMSPVDVLEVVQLGGVGHSDITPGREKEGKRKKDNITVIQG